MIDIAWSEFLFIALVALILVGPKELPSVLRNIGRWVGKARTFAKDLSEQLDLQGDADGSPPEKIGIPTNESFVEKKNQTFENTKP